MESFIPAKSFQVLYDFEGTNDRELTVTSGEILLAQDKKSEDDWIFVVKMKDSTKKGFVPAGYIKELSVSETARYISAWNTDSIPLATSPTVNRITSIANFPSSSTRAYPNLLQEQKASPPSSPNPYHNASATNLSLSALNSPTRVPSPSRNLEERLSAKRPTTPTQNKSSSASPKPSSSASASSFSNSVTSGAQSSVMEMFAKHEAYLRQVMRQREDKFRELEKSILTTGKEIEKYKELNDTLFQKVMKLESALDLEHGKLKQKIMDEERRVASPTFAQ